MGTFGTEEVLSPPYPGDGTGVELLFVRLTELRDWVSSGRIFVSERLAEGVVPVVREFPEKRLYLQLPVMQFFRQFLFLRRLREEWDHLVRLYESDWDCDACVKQRAFLFHNAAIFLNEAFMAYECREAREQRQVETMQKSFERLMAFLASVVDAPPPRSESEGG